jgi:hypothetical protein
MNWHPPTLGPGRADYMVEYTAGIFNSNTVFDPAGGGDASMPPGGWPFGDPRGGVSQIDGVKQ